MHEWCHISEDQMKVREMRVQDEISIWSNYPTHYSKNERSRLHSV